MLTTSGLRVTVYTSVWCDNQTYYSETCDAITTKDVKRLPVNRLPVLKPITSFKNVEPVIEFM